MAVVLDGRAATVVETGTDALHAPSLDTARPQPSQSALPTLRRVVDPGADPFAHPAERELARLLDFYRVRWVYEPTAFAIGRDEQGKPNEFFTPDFYLPDHRLYIELTTMRQELVTRKNRKLRLLRQLYPNVRIRLLYRRDYARIAEVFPRRRELERPVRISRVVFPEPAIRERIDRVAQEIAADLASRDRGEPLPLLLRTSGESCPLAEALASGVARRGVPTASDRVELSRYRFADAAQSVSVRRAPLFPLEGRRVVVITDVVSTGLSHAFLRDWLLKRGASGVSVCALLDRKSARLVDVPIAHVAFEAPDEPLAGWGLRLRRQYRDLPFIAAVEPDDDSPVGETFA